MSVQTCPFLATSKISPYFAFLARGFAVFGGPLAAGPLPPGRPVGPDDTDSGRNAATAAGPAPFLRLSEKSCQNNTIGLATKTEEYVPIIIPTTSANENPCRTGPPNRNRAITVTKVRP